jgi:multidrug efflux system membrane fusion protein
MDEQVDRQLSANSLGRTVVDRSVAPPRVRRRFRWRLAIGTIVVILLALVVWREFPSMFAASHTPADGSRGAGGPPQAVGVATATRADVRVIVNALGTVTPLETVTVKTQIAGQLQQIAFTEGQHVNKGDFLAQIDPRPYQAALDLAQAQLAKDQAVLKQAQVDLLRYQTLLKQDSIARQQADDQVYLVQQDEAAIRSDQAQIDTQKLNLAYCHIVSPITGRVGLRQVDAGNYVQTSDTNGIVVVTQEQPISVLFAITEDNLPQVLKQYHAGGTLAVTAYDRANVEKLATGELATLDNEIDTTTGTVKLRGLFANADESLFPNQFVNIRLLVDTLHDVVTVPTAAIQRGAPGAYVYAVAANSTVAVKPVKIGVTDGDKVQIIAGISAGDKVVVDGADRLRDGVTVKATEQGPPGKASAAAGEPPAHAHHHQQNGAPPAAAAPAP